MKKRQLACGCTALLAGFTVLIVGALIAWQFVRPQPAPKTETWFEGVEYTRDIRSSPRDLVIHVVRVNLQADGIRLLVTPGEPKEDLPIAAQSTSDFLRNFDAQVAINGSPFEPWSSLSTLRYYPHKGDRVSPIGLAASEGEVYSEAHPDAPTLYLAINNKARFNRPFQNIYNAISGTEMLIRNGKNVAQDDGAPQPRTAVGLNRAGNELILIVVDGRQPGYSEGATLTELAEIMAFYEVYNGMNLDGGGSSTLVRQGAFGSADVVNNPIDRSIPGWERVVGNHLGIFAKEKK